MFVADLRLAASTKFHSHGNKNVNFLNLNIFQNIKSIKLPAFVSNLILMKSFENINNMYVVCAIMKRSKLLFIQIHGCFIL